MKNIFIMKILISKLILDLTLAQFSILCRKVSIFWHKLAYVWTNQHICSCKYENMKYKIYTKKPCHTYKMQIC